MSGEEAAAFMVQERSRFMIACKGDEKEAIKRLKETAAFLYPDDGEGNLLDSNFQHFFFLKKVYPHGFLGRSKMGSFVFLDKMGIFHHTMKELRKHNIGKAELLEHTKLILMWFCEKIDPQPFPQGRFVRVFDFKGFKMSHARDVGAIRMGMSIIRMIEKYFPERLEKCYVINAPPVLFHLWNSIVKNMLDKKTAEKFCIVKGMDKSCKLMQELMPVECLLKEYGGMLEHIHDAMPEKELYEHIQNKLLP